MKNIVKKLVLIVGLSILATAHAEEENDQKKYIYLSQCSNFGDGVSYFFQSCVNSNFSTIARELGGFYLSCTNFSKEVDAIFTSCVNSGFRDAARSLENNVWLPDCYNFDRTKLDYSFISCVNSNFGQIQREIAQRDN